MRAPLTKGVGQLGKLKFGDKLLESDREVATVVSLAFTGIYGKTYNFEVDGFHTYFVDAKGIWVHNGDCLTGSSKLASRKEAFRAAKKDIGVTKGTHPN
ncbi:MAG: hypothetical protein EOP04_31775, partial [Proteobacteria bacterium]